MRHIWWVLGLKKNSPLIAVRIEVLCFYTFFNNFKFFEFSGYQIEAHSKGSQFSIFFWFLALIFGLAGVRICKGFTLKSIFFSKSHKFFKIVFFCCFQDIRWICTQKAVNFSEFLEKIHQICWFFGNDFHLQMAPGVRKPLGVTQRKKNSSEIYKF